MQKTTAQKFGNQIFKFCSMNCKARMSLFLEKKRHNKSGLEPINQKYKTPASEILEIAKA